MALARYGDTMSGSAMITSSSTSSTCSSRIIELVIHVGLHHWGTQIVGLYGKRILHCGEGFGWTRLLEIYLGGEKPEVDAEGLHHGELLKDLERFIGILRLGYLTQFVEKCGRIVGQSGNLRAIVDEPAVESELLGGVADLDYLLVVQFGLGGKQAVEFPCAPPQGRCGPLSEP